MPYEDDYEVEDFGEFGADPVGQGQDEWGAAVGDDEDEYGASPRGGYKARYRSRPMPSARRLASVARSLATGARSGRISRRKLMRLSRVARRQSSRCPSRSFPWGGAGFGPPVGPGTGSYGMPLGLGTSAGVAVATNFVLANANNRGVPLRVKRLVLSIIDVSAVAVGRIAGSTNNGCVITAITVGDFPLLTGGNVPSFCFAPDNYSPISYNQVLYPGTNFTVNGTTPAAPAATLLTITGACEVAQM